MNGCMYLCILCLNVCTYKIADLGNSYADIYCILGIINIGAYLKKIEVQMGA